MFFLRWFASCQQALWVNVGLACLVTSAMAAESSTAAPGASALDPRHAAAAAQLWSAATNSSLAMDRLAELCDRFGARPTGSTNLEQAIDWILIKLRQDGFANVHGEEVEVPHWVRGEESAVLLEPRRESLRVLGVGGSVPTLPEGIEAPVLVVESLDALRRPGTDARGKIVVFNTPFTDYGATVAIRTRGAIEAAKAGAVAGLIRSVTPYSMQTPHTGILSYDPAVPRIPHAAITVETAMMLQRMQDRGQPIRIRLKLQSQSLPNAISRNVVAELPGRESPQEIVVLSAHIDSWDVGQGAMDDGGGCLAVWEAIRLIRASGLQPRRTLRLVLWTGEENGIWGAKAYRKAHREELSKHLLAVESDRGVFAPTGFAFTGSERARRILQEMVPLLKPTGATEFTLGNGGMDVNELLAEGVPAMDLAVDRTRYFWFHHTEADTVDKLDLKEMQRCVAALAILGYVVADLPEAFPR